MVGMKFCPILPRSQQYYRFSMNYILRLPVDSFIPARRDPLFVLPGSRFAETKFSHVIASARLSGMKKLINTHISTIDRRYFYCVFTTHMTSICEKITNIFVEFHHFTEAATGVFCKKGEYFAIFTRKHLCWSLFAGPSSAILLKGDSKTNAFL